MTIQLQNISSETIYVQDMSFVAKGCATKHFLQIFLNLVICETFPIQNFYAYGTHISIQLLRYHNEAFHGVLT